MKTIQINVYSIDELQREAYKKAINKYRFCYVEDSSWCEWALEDFIALCNAIGISVFKEKIYFSSFYSQGGGSTFEADVNILQFIKGIETGAWREYAPNVDLLIPVFKLDNRIKALIENGTISSYCTVRNPLRGYWTNVDTGFDYSYNQCREYQRIDQYLNLLEKWLDDAIDTLNLYLYKSLEDEYQYQTSDEAIIEAIRSNEHHFTVDGQSAEWILAIDTISAA